MALTVTDEQLGPVLAAKRTACLAWWGVPMSLLNDEGVDLGILSDSEVYKAYGYEMAAPSHPGFGVIVISYIIPRNKVIVSADIDNGSFMEFMAVQNASTTP